MTRRPIRTRRHPPWLGISSTALLIPFLILTLDTGKLAWAIHVGGARKGRLIVVANHLGVDPQVLIDPDGFQKKEAERAKVRRAEAVKEAERLSAPDPVKLKAAQAEREAVKQ